jgi:hypothetical protein
MRQLAIDGRPIEGLGIELRTEAFHLLAAETRATSEHRGEDGGVCCWPRRVVSRTSEVAIETRDPGLRHRAPRARRARDPHPPAVRHIIDIREAGRHCLQRLRHGELVAAPAPHLERMIVAIGPPEHRLEDAVQLREGQVAGHA